MAFVLVNGWQVPVKLDTGSRELLTQGELSPSWSNRPNRRRQALARKYTFTTSELSADDATTLEGLLEGRGHYWEFRYSFHSSAGLGPEAGYSASDISYAAASAGPVSGVAIRISSGTMVFDTQLPDSWTVSYMVSTSATSGWAHKVIRSDGAKWQNGTRNDALVHNELYVSSGAVVLYDSGAPSNPYFAELVVLPFKASDGFVSSLRPSGVQFSALPRLKLAGSLTGNKFIEVMGSAAGQGYTQGVKTGSWASNTREVQAELEEVVPRKEGPTLPFRAHTSFVFNRDTLSGTTRRPIVGDFTSLANAGQTYTTNIFVPGDQYVSVNGTQTGENSGQDMTNSLQGASIISGVVAFYFTSRAPGADVFLQLVDNGPSISQLSLRAEPSSILTAASPTNTSQQSLSISHTVSVGYLYILGFFADFASGAMGVGWCRGVNTGTYGSPLESDFITGAKTFTATSFQSPTARPVNFLRPWNSDTNYNPRGTAFYAALIKDRRISESDLRQTYRAITAGNFR